MSRNAVRAGIVAAAALGLFYALVVGTVGGLEHLAQQTVDDWPWLVLILAGFGTQIGLFVELRRRRRLDADVRAAAGTGAGASAVGMVACCAHHVADLAPIIGASGAAVFLTEYRTPIMVAGIGINALGVFLAARRLGRTPAPAVTGR
jgi:hypothetical protein